MVQARATTVAPPEFPALVNASDYIVRAVTKSVTAERQTDPHGVKIVTKVELEVREVVAGTPPATITLELLGGRVGDEKLTVEGMPQFRVGDEDILFVSGNGRTFCPLVAMTYGRYPVATDSITGKKYMTRADGQPLLSTAEVTAPVAEGRAADSSQRHAAAVAVALEPAEFIRQIRAVLNPATRSSVGK